MLWKKTLGTSGVGGFEKIIKARDGNYVVAGFTEINSREFDLDLYAVKVSASGSIIWEKNYDFNYITDTTVDLIEASNGDFIIAASQLKAKGVYKEGKEDGTWEVFNEQGKLIAKVSYKLGIKMKTEKFD